MALPWTLASSSLFFVTTNLAVWLFGHIYAHNLAGLTRCFRSSPYRFPQLLSRRPVLYWFTLWYGHHRQASS